MESPPSPPAPAAPGSPSLPLPGSITTPPPVPFGGAPLPPSRPDGRSSTGLRMQAPASSPARTSPSRLARGAHDGISARTSVPPARGAAQMSAETRSAARRRGTAGGRGTTGRRRATGVRRLTARRTVAAIEAARGRTTRRRGAARAVPSSARVAPRGQVFHRVQAASRHQERGCNPAQSPGAEEDHGACKGSTVRASSVRHTGTRSLARTDAPGASKAGRPGRGTAGVHASVAQPGTHRDRFARIGACHCPPVPLGFTAPAGRAPWRASAAQPLHPAGPARGRAPPPRAERRADRAQGRPRRSCW